MKKIMFSVFFGVSVLVSSAGEKVHTVKPGESLYSIARQYSVTVNDLKRMNATLVSSTNIKAGQKLVVSATATKATALPTLNTTPAKVHTVTKGESCYGICKKYGVSVSELKQWNGLPDLNVKIGQRLIVSKVNSMALYKPNYVPSTPDTPYQEEDIRPRFTMPGNEVAMASDENTSIPTPEVKPVPEVAKPVALTTGLRTSSTNSAEYPAIFNQYPAHGYKIKKSKGAANYMEEAMGGNQNLAFYNNAENGSVIRVTNLMNHRTIFVKVIGKVPPVDAGNEITIKLSNKAAKDLGAIDEKFLVEVASFSAN
ncbi:MAG TPA: LysM peptidoglycan-binding domain-containing protein [Chitinophagales bacterium]|nr:LysM peptidoglycan-binding domain-containing protein [Chitinophagales bacterium]